MSDSLLCKCYYEFLPCDDVIVIFAEKEKKKDKNKEEPGSFFQRERVDVLLAELARKYPIKYTPVPQPEKQEEKVEAIKTEIKTEKTDASNTTSQGSIKPPPEKKPKLLR